jgi:fatty acid amide hydrolase
MYTVVWNILDYSAGVVPVTNVQENEQFYKINQEKYGRRDKFAKTMVELMNGSAGLPVAVQVVTLPHEDETCLRVMNEIEKEVQFNFPEGLK